jgi:hypothetical protein
VLSFFIESLDIESFDIVSFFMVSSANAGASASPNDKVAADRMTAVRLIMMWQSPGGRHFPAWQRMSPSKTSNGAAACYAPGKIFDHDGVNDSGAPKQ